MNTFSQAWAALKNMLRAAARDPLWAFVALVTGPFRAIGYVARMGALFFLVLLVVGGGLMALMQWAGIQRGDVLWYVGNIAFTAFLVLFVFRLVSLPLIRHFGDMDGRRYPRLGPIRYRQGSPPPHPRQLGPPDRPRSEVEKAPAL